MSTTCDLADILNAAYAHSVDQAIEEYGLPASAAEPLNNWIQAQEEVLRLEEEVQAAAQRADAIVDSQLQYLAQEAV